MPAVCAFNKRHDHVYVYQYQACPCLISSEHSPPRWLGNFLACCEAHVQELQSKRKCVLGCSCVYTSGSEMAGTCDAASILRGCML